MRTATVRDLRTNFARLSRWLENGEEVEITKRGAAFGRLVPVIRASEKEAKRPNFSARRKAIFGAKILEGNSALLMREGSEW
jgi:antitoxin (DNA-binding transcriptional repressor) of toxin-antitoxin stability system